MTDVLAAIARQRVVPVLRCADPGDAVATAHACAAGGMEVVELTHSTPDVERAVEELGNAGNIIVGVGTITSAGQVGAAAAAGASFAVSFANPDGFLPAADAAGIPAFPGAFTPSEVLACAEGGAEAVKIFPARAATPSYLRDLAAVMPDVELLVTGGLEPTRASIEPWLAAGAVAVGLGGALGTAAAVGAGEVTRRCRNACEAAR